VVPRWKQDASRYDYWRRMQFTYDQWCKLATHTRERGLAFIVSPFSIAAFDLVKPTMTDAWKIASGEIGNLQVVMRASDTRLPVFISTGMATFREAELAWMSTRGGVALLQCTSEYPTPPQRTGLRVIRELGARFPLVPVGLSDHSGTIYAGLAAVALGCDVLEVHVTFSREMQGFDTASSITTAELRQLVEGVRFIEKAKQPVDKDALARELEPMRRLFMDKHKRKADGVRQRGCPVAADDPGSKRTDLNHRTGEFYHGDDGMPPNWGMRGANQP
jgi:N-acetylneuraminate synthase